MMKEWELHLLLDSIFLMKYIESNFLDTNGHKKKKKQIDETIRNKMGPIDQMKL